MLEEAPAPIGHNGGPAFDPAALEEHTATVGEFLQSTKVWLDVPVIDNEADAESLTDQIDGLRKLHKNVDEQRKAEKKPYDDAGKAVQAAYSPLLEKVKRAADALKPKLGAYITEKTRREAEAKAAEEAKARREAEAAAAALTEAQEANDISAQVEAEEAAKAAEAAEKAAQKPINTKVGSATGAGRTISMRTVKTAVITNARHTFLYYQDRPEVLDVLQRLATGEMRSAGYDHDAAPVPGCDMKVTKVPA